MNQTHKHTQPPPPKTQGSQEPGAHAPNPRTKTQEPDAPDAPNPHPHREQEPGAPNPEPEKTPNNQPPHPPTTKPQEGKKKRETRRTPNPRKHGGQARTTPKKRETPTVRQNHEHKNMTHYRDLKQHTHRDSTVRVRGPPPPGSARGASVSRTSEADSGPEPAVTGLLRLSSPRPPSGHWISPSPLGPERTLRTGGEAVKPRDGEPAHNAGPPSCPSCPGRFPDPAPRQGRRATARVRRPLRTSTTPPASSCSWAIGASSSSTLTLLR